ADDAGSLGDRAAGGREQIRDRDANGLRQEGEDHVGTVRFRNRSTRRTSGTDAATAMMTAPCRTSTIVFGTSALIARPPCDRVAKKTDASTMPTGVFRPTSATAMPRNPAPVANPSS